MTGFPAPLASPDLALDQTPDGWVRRAPLGRGLGRMWAREDGTGRTGALKERGRTLELWPGQPLPFQETPGVWLKLARLLLPKEARLYCAV